LSIGCCRQRHASIAVRQWGQTCIWWSPLSVPAVVALAKHPENPELETS
jgi:hypothetical protein